MISFTSASPTGAAVNGATYNPTAISSANLAIVITVDASSTSVCVISSNIVRFVGSGSCLLTATSAGNLDFNSASQQQNFFVGKGVQTVTFTTAAPATAPVGGSPYAPSAISSVGLAPILFSSSTPAICSVTNGLVSFSSVGNCVLSASQAGNANFLAGGASQSITVVQGVAVITFTSAAPSDAQLVSPPYAVTTVSSSGLPVTFAIDASSANVCTFANGFVSFGLQPGVCRVNANSGSNADYATPAQVQQAFGVGLAAQTITITSAPPAVGVAVSGGR